MPAVDSLAAKGPVVLLSARGKTFSHEDAVRYAVQPDLTLLCGHYKDVDQRVADHLATEALSLGRFVLSGGEVGALVVADRMRSVLNETDFDLGKDLAMTCSLGVAAVPDTVSAIDKLIDAASSARQES